MIGIGLVNVINIIEIVFVCFICVFFIVIVVVMFLGVVGGVGCISIGDVVILVWWILDNGVIFCGVDFGMLVIVQMFFVVLDNINMFGNFVCLCRNVLVVWLNYLGCQL